VAPGDPVAWIAIERGWRVVGSDGKEIGKVDEIAGDTGVDIFNGLTISTSLFSAPRYVPSEQVAQIVEGEVRLSIPAGAVGNLKEYAKPPSSLEVSSEASGTFDRVAKNVVGDSDERPGRSTLWTRLRDRIFRR
jgi:hypothetical protein